jgi:hypothetical protein
MNEIPFDGPEDLNLDPNEHVTDDPSIAEHNFMSGVPSEEFSHGIQDSTPLGDEGEVSALSADPHMDATSHDPVNVIDTQAHHDLHPDAGEPRFGSGLCPHCNGTRIWYGEVCTWCKGTGIY